MNTTVLHAPSKPDWTDANQRFLTAEFARFKALLGDGGSQAAARSDAAQTGIEPPGDSAAINILARMFGLSVFERDMLLLCAGVEMDARLAQLCAEAQGSPQRTYATFGLALGALAEPHWSAITPLRPLRRWRLVEVDESAGLTSARLKIDERILHYLAGVNYLDGRLQPMLRPCSPPRLMAAAHAATAEQILARLQTANGALPVMQLAGDDRAGQEDVAAAVARRLGLQLHVLAAADIPDALHEREALAVLWEREAVLLGSALLIGCGENGDAVRRLAERLTGLVFLAAREPLLLDSTTPRYSVRKPDTRDQKRLWQEALGGGATRADGALDAIAAQFRLSARSISAVGAELGPGLAAGADADSALWRACRGLDGAPLDQLAQRIEPCAGWADLILPEAQENTLRQIARGCESAMSSGESGAGQRSDAHTV